LYDEDVDLRELLNRLSNFETFRRDFRAEDDKRGNDE
jgi:hypothetical protein